MEEQNNNKPKPRNIFEQMAYALETINDNITDLYALTREIHEVIYNIKPKDGGLQE